MITQRKSWLVATVAMMLLVPVKGLAYEVGDEFEVQIDVFNYDRDKWFEKSLTLNMTVLDPVNHKVAIWKRYDSDAEVNQENLIEDGQIAFSASNDLYQGRSNGYYDLPDEVTAPDGETYTISAIGANAFNWTYNHLVINRLPSKLELVGSYATFTDVGAVGHLDFSKLPLLKIVGEYGFCLKKTGGTLVFEDVALEELYGGLPGVVGNEVDFSKLPKLKRIHNGAFANSIISKREFHIPATIEYIETGSFSYDCTYRVTDMYFDHTSANSIEWKVYYMRNSSNPYITLRDFPVTTVNIHVCDEILQQCKDGTREDEFANYYKAAPSTLDREADWQTGRGFFVTTPIGDGTMDMQYTINDYDKREVIIFPNMYMLDSYDEPDPNIFYGTPGWKDGFITVTEPADLTIPETVKGPNREIYTVVGVGTSAFANCPFLKNVTLPTTVRSICASAFCYSSIQTLNLNQLKSLCYVGTRAFAGSSLTGDIELADGVTKLDGYTFRETNVTSFKSNKIKQLESWEFYECKQLATVTFDAPLEVIGPTADYYDEILQNDDADGTADAYYREGGTFAGCTNLTTVNFSDAGNLTYIGPGSFTGTGLSGNLVIPEGVRYLCGMLFNKENCTFGGTKITSVVFPSTLLFDAGSFGGCTTLESADLTKCTKVRMLNGTFSGCTALTKVDMLPRYEYLKDMHGTFNDCISLGGELVFPDGVVDASYNDNMAVTKITYPKSVRIIGANNCPNLTTVNFTDLEHLTQIYGFANCDLQGEVNIGDKVFYMTGYDSSNYLYGAFANNQGITKVYYPATMETFEGSHFFKCPGITDIYVKRYNTKASNLTDLDGKYLSMNGPTGTKIHVSQRIIDECKAGTSNGFQTWYNANPDCLMPYDEASLPTGCKIKMQLPLVNDDGEENGETATVYFTIIDSEKREIGVLNPRRVSYNSSDEDGYYYSTNGTYYYYGGEDQLYHGDGLNSDNWSVTKMTGEGFLILPETYDLKDGNTYTLTMIGTGAFQGYYFDKNGGWYGYGQGYRSQTFEKLLGILIPKSVKRLGNYAFAGNSELGLVIFEDGSQLEHIGKYAFEDLDYPAIDLTTLPNLKIIDDGAFRSTEGYGATLKFGETVETIGEEAFAEMGLEGTLELPASLKRLGARAFNKNDKVSRVNFKSEDVIWEGDGELSENFGEVTIVGAAQSIIDQCATGTRKDQFRAYFPNQLVSLGGSSAADLTGDGKVDNDDIDLLRKYVMGDHSVLSATAADVNKDGVVNVADIVALVGLMIAMGK